MSEGSQYFLVSDRSLIGTAIWFGLAAGITLLSVLIYELVRRISAVRRIMYTRLYSAIGETPPYPAKPFEWMITAVTLDESFYMENVGLDGAMFLRFIRMSLRFCLFMFIFALPVLLPVNYYTSQPTEVAVPTNSTTPRSQLDRWSISNYPPNSSILYLHVFYAYLMTAALFYVFFMEYRRYAQHATEYLKENGIIARKTTSWRKGERLQLRTIMVEGIPQAIRCDDMLKQWFESLGIGEVEVAYVDRLMGHEIQELFTKRARVLNNLEKAYMNWAASMDRLLIKKEIHDQPIWVKWWLKFTRRKCNRQDISLTFDELHQSRPTISKPLSAGKFKIKNVFKLHGDRFMEEHDAIDYYSNQLVILSERLKQQRYIAQEPILYTTPNENLCGNVAFVTFKTQRAAQIAAQVLLHSDLSALALRVKSAPAPQDILWSSLSMDDTRKYVQRFVITLLTVILCFFIAVPTAALVGLVNLDKLQTIPAFEGFVRDVRANHLLLLVVQTVVPQVIVGLTNWTLVPLLLQFLSYHQGFHSHSRAERAMMSKYYAFIFFNVLFIFTIGSAVTELLSGIVQNPLIAIQKVFINIPTGSDFFIQYIIFSIMVFSAELIRIWPLIWGTFMQRFILKTPRQIHDNALFTSYLDYGWLYPVHVLVLVIVLCYAVIAPLILAPAVCYFAWAWMIYRNQLAYVFVKEWESFGRHFNIAFKSVMIGLVIAQLTLIFILASKLATVAAILVLPLIPATYIFYVHCRRHYYARTMFVPLDQLPMKSSSALTTPEISLNPVGQEQVNMEDTLDVKKVDTVATSEADHETDTNVVFLPEEHVQERFPMKYLNPVFSRLLSRPWLPLSHQRFFQAYYEQEIINRSRAASSSDINALQRVSLSIPRSEVRHRGSGVVKVHSPLSYEMADLSRPISALDLANTSKAGSADRLL